MNSSTFKTVVLWVTLIGVGLVLWKVISNGATGAKVQEISYTEFVSKVNQSEILDVTINGNDAQGHYRNDKSHQFRLTVPGNNPELLKLLQDHNKANPDREIVFSFKDTQSSNWPLWLINLSPVVLLGVLWAVPVFWDRRFLLVMAGWDVLILLAWIVDLLRLPRPGRLTVERSWAGAVSLRNPVNVILQVRNLGGADIYCQVLDDMPDALRSEPAIVEIQAPAASFMAQQYAVRALQRGDIEVGQVYLRYQSSARFAERWARADLSQTVRVFPDLDEAKRHNIYLSRARQIELVKLLVRQRGMGREFESLREYREGDEFRNICWSATARRGKHVTKLYQVERSQAVWLVIDAGRLLRARVGELSKLDLATNAALSIAQIALYSGDRVGVLVYGR